MYREIDEHRKSIQGAKTMEEFVDSLDKEEPTVVLKEYNEPTTPPCFEKRSRNF